MATLRHQFNYLPKNARKTLSWDEVIEALGSKEELLERIKVFNNPYIFEIDSNLNLLIFDGNDEVYSGRDENYFDCRKEAARLGLRLFTLQEYTHFRWRYSRVFMSMIVSNIDLKTNTWIESGDNPLKAQVSADGDDLTLGSDEADPNSTNPKRGARYLLSLKLNFKSPLETLLLKAKIFVMNL
jgi:hypothetical protein